jgi:mycothione reductase
VLGSQKSGLGGTCLNRGCIPSKMLIHAADVATSVRDSYRFGVNASINSIDFTSLVERVEAEVDADSNAIEGIYARANPERRRWIRGSVRFVAPQTLRVTDGNNNTNKLDTTTPTALRDYDEEEITGDHIVIAGGCVPLVPSIDGLSETPFLTSTEALRLKTQPKRMAVLGAGYIACGRHHTSFYPSLSIILYHSLVLIYRTGPLLWWFR